MSLQCKNSWYWKTGNFLDKNLIHIENIELITSEIIKEK